MAHKKREGDGKSPIGTWSVTLKSYRSDRLPKIRSAKGLTHFDGWCDDPRHGQYNRLIRLPFTASHEVMMREDCAYDIVFATNHNQCPRVRAGGSAIFLHLIADGATCTAGCVAVSLRDMRKILQLCQSKITLRIGR